MEFKQKTISFLLTMLIIANISFAAENKVDSLEQALVKTYDDSSKAAILVQLAIETNIFDREKSIVYYTEALQFEKDKHNRAIILDKIGLFNWQLGNYSSSINYLNKSLLLFVELKDSIWLGRVNNNLGAVNWGLGNTIEALEYYQIGLEIRKAIKDMKGVSNILNNIGLIYQDWGLYDEALKWHNEALSIATDIEELAAIAYSYSNVGKCYENQKEFDTALKFYQLGFKTILKEEESNRSIPFFLTPIGSVYSKMGELDSAVSFHQKSLTYAKRTNNKNRIAIAEYYLGKTYFELNKVNIASKYIHSSYKHSMENNYYELIKDNQFVLSEIEEKKGNTSKAFKYFKSASAMKDSTFNKEKIEKFTKLQVEYHLEKKSRENAILRKDNEIHQLTIEKQNDLRDILLISGVIILTFLILITKSRISFKNISVKLKKSEKKLLESNANKDKFFSIISHDLKSPFNGILGATEMLSSEYDELTSEEAKEMIQIVRESSTKAYELLEGLLEWARTQTDRMEYEFKNIDIYKISTKTTELLKTHAHNKNISFESEIKRNKLVFADEKATETVLRNLITNAIKFTQPDGVIKIEAEDREDEVAICVSDNGIGMSEADKNKLFKIEVHHTTVGTNNEVGTGVGLILCKELVEKQGGKIWVESELEKGSKFIFTLPRKTKN